MDTIQSRHLARVRQLRASFAEANERLVARLRRVTDEAASRNPSGGWTAAQIGWHVATVNNRFAGLISGEIAGAARLPDSFVERPWQEIAAAIPDRLRVHELVDGGADHRSTLCARGVTEFVGKPVAAALLAESLRRVTGRKRS